MAETGITRQRILSELSKSPHGSLKEYLPIGKQAVLQEGEFYQHMLAWDRTHGQIRDSKVALPVIQRPPPIEIRLSRPVRLAKISQSYISRLPLMEVKTFNPEILVIALPWIFTSPSISVHPG